LPRKKVALAFGDAFCTAAALIVAVTLRLGWEQGSAYLGQHPRSLFLAWAVFMLVFYLVGLYESEHLLRPARTVGSAALAVSLGTLVISTIFYAALSPEIGRGIFLGFATFVFVGVVVMRLLYMTAIHRGFLAQRCLVIGTNDEATKIIRLIHTHPHGGMRILGVIHAARERAGVGRFIGDYPVLGTLETLEKFVDLYAIDRLILAASVEYEPVLLRRLRSFRYRGLALVDYVALHEELAQEIPLDHINDEWLFSASLNNSRFHARRLKRLVDLLAALFGLLITAPLLGICALLVKLTSPGPVLFRQERLGRDSVPFELLKLRTMQADAESETGPVWAAEDDPRITPVGRWLRQVRIDEIPQLWNVVRGDMSLVGPRPERSVFIKKLTQKIPFYAERLLVPPGITGWAQVMHPYAASIEESRRKLQFDLYYIKHMSFLLDLSIMLRTAKTMLFGRERVHLTAPTVPATAPTPELPTETVPFPGEATTVRDRPDARAAHGGGQE